MSINSSSSLRCASLCGRIFCRSREPTAEFHNHASFDCAGVGICRVSSRKFVAPSFLRREFLKPCASTDKQRPLENVGVSPEASFVMVQTFAFREDVVGLGAKIDAATTSFNTKLDACLAESKAAAEASRAAAETSKAAAAASNTQYDQFTAATTAAAAASKTQYDQFTAATTAAAAASKTQYDQSIAVTTAAAAASKTQYDRMTILMVTLSVLGVLCVAPGNSMFFRWLGLT